MNSEGQSELERIEKLISDRFDKQDAKINDIRKELAGVKEETNKEETNIVEKVFAEYIDPIGKAVMGELWRDVYETLQDAISLSFLFLIPGWIGKLILKEDYSSFDQCYKAWNGGNGWNTNLCGCDVIVGAGFVFWFLITARIMGRAINRVKNIIKNIFSTERTEGEEEKK